jgi:hypothetical protein
MQDLFMMLLETLKHLLGLLTPQVRLYCLFNIKLGGRSSISFGWNFPGDNAGNSFKKIGAKTEQKKKVLQPIVNKMWK